MKQWKLLVVLAFTVLLSPIAVAQSPIGNWTAVDDKTGQNRAVVHLSLSGNVLNGTIVKIYPQPDDSGICSNCPGGFKNKPIKGLQFIWGLKDQGDGDWSDGHILDPRSGKVYRAKISVKGDKLYLRGYIGLSAIGRTQIWARHP